MAPLLDLLTESAMFMSQCGLSTVEAHIFLWKSWSKTELNGKGSGLYVA